MIKYLKKLLRLKPPGPSQHKTPEDSRQNKPLSADLKDNIRRIKKLLGASSDVVFRPFVIGDNEAVLVFIESLTDVKTINEYILQPLLGWRRHHPLTPDNIRKHLVTVSQTTQTGKMDDLISGCLSGDTILFIDNCSQALLLNTRGFESRSIKEPDTEVVVRGPKDGFNEKLQTNLSLIRRRLKTPNLVIENLSLGIQSSTTVSVVYLKNIAREDLVREVKKRLNDIKIDAILESGFIEQLIEDAPLSPFPTISNSEKPDIVAAKLLEGRVAIITDGTPVVLIVPKLFVESFQSAEDYYSRPFYASLLRMLRYISFLITTMAPGIYVGLVTYHQELIPTNLVISMASAREATPFPAVVEALGMGAIYEIFREAGIRLPRPVGSAISIVGALVIGEAAVDAGLVSAPLLIVVALTAISSYVVNALADVSAILRLLFTVFAGFMGVFGFMMVFLGILIHLCALRSFGTPYLAPLAPLKPRGVLDLFIRAPIQALTTRPALIAKGNKQRQNPAAENTGAGRYE